MAMVLSGEVTIALFNEKPFAVPIEDLKDELSAIGGQ
jgi:hypothetical protein